MTVFFLTREIHSVRSLVVHLRSVPTGERVVVHHTTETGEAQRVEFMFDPDRHLTVTCDGDLPAWVAIVKVFLNHPVHQGGQPHHAHHDPDGDPDLQAEGPSGEPA